MPIETGEPLGEQLSRYIKRILALKEEQKAVSAALTETYQQAKLEGLVVSVLKEIVKRAEMEPEARQEWEDTLLQYQSALSGQLMLFEAAGKIAEMCDSVSFKGPGLDKTVDLRGVKKAS